MMKNMLNRLKEKQNKKGFTLVEIIVVLVVLAILAAIAIPAVLGYIDDAKKSKYTEEARAIFLVVQTEEAKMCARDGVGAYDETKPDVMSHYNDLYRKLLDYGSAAEHIISKKTEIPYVSYVEREGVGNSGTGNTNDYVFIWQSSDGKYITAHMKTNKKVTITDIS